MGRSLWMVLVSILFVAACGGSSQGAGTGPKEEGNGGRGPGSSGDTPAPARPDPTTKLGVVAIDLQKVFFATANARNPKSNPNERMKRAQRVFELAAAKDVPFFITYEDAKSGDHALPPSLASVLPKAAHEIIKTTFAATGQPTFVPAIDA